MIYILTLFWHFTDQTINWLTKKTIDDVHSIFIYLKHILDDMIEKYPTGFKSVMLQLHVTMSMYFNF